MGIFGGADVGAFRLRIARNGASTAVLVTGLIAAAGIGSAQAQNNFLIYGNFCGPGNRGPGYPPIDALDLACARHDACSPGLASGRSATCACNRRLQAEAGYVARDPRAPPFTRETAQVISDFAALLPCE